VEAGVSSRVLVLTTFDLDSYVYEALRAGASGFVLKDMPREELVQAVRTVADGETPLAPAVVRRLLARFLDAPPPDRAGRPDPRLARLTERERDVLRLVADGMSNAEIADRLVVSPATVKTHVASLLRKLEVRDRLQAAMIALQTGLVDR
jgi:DNA-binding NarL/FixJ family response regulator